MVSECELWILFSPYFFFFFSFFLSFFFFLDLWIDLCLEEMSGKKRVTYYYDCKNDGMRGDEMGWGA